MKHPILLLVPLLLLTACNKDKVTTLAQCKADVLKEGVAEEKESYHWLQCMNKNGFKLIQKNVPSVCQDIPQNSHGNEECYEPASLMDRLSI